MSQSDESRTPEGGRPRGPAWRMLVSEGIVWEGQVTITGEQSDLDARLIVTGQRLVFVRNGTIALDAQREWLTPPPVIDRDGNVTLAIKTPNGTSPIPVEIQMRDGRFGATRLLNRLGFGQQTPAAPPVAPTFSPAPADARAERRERAAASDPSRPASAPRRPSEPSKSVPGLPADRSSSFGAPHGPAPTPSPAPSFGVPSNRPAVGSSAGPAPESSPRLSRDVVARAFGARPGDLNPPGAPDPAPVPPPAEPATPTPDALVPSPASDVSRWTLSSALLARIDQSPTPASPGAPTSTAIPALSAGTGPRADQPVARQDTTPLPRLGAPVPPGSADPVSFARARDTTPPAPVLPALPSSTPEQPTGRSRASAAPSGRIAGNAVITARSSAAARLAARQGTRADQGRTGELIPSAVQLASIRAGVPLAPEPGPVPASDVQVTAAAPEPSSRRFIGGFDRARIAWGLTATALILMTLTAGLYLAIGIPDRRDGDQADIGQAPTAVTTGSAAGQTAILPGSGLALTATVTDVVAAVVSDPPKPTATATEAIPRGVGGETEGQGVATVGPTSTVTASGPVDDGTGGLDGTTPADSGDPETGETGVGIAAISSDEPAATSEPTEVSTATSEPTEVSTATSEPTEVPTATSEPTATEAPTATTAATEAPTATAAATEAPTEEPTATPTEEPTATPTKEPTATPTEEPTATPTKEPTATSEPTVVPTPGPDVEPQSTTVAADGVPSQVFIVGSVRYTVESVSAGATIPEINQPQPPFGGDWLAVVLYAENWGEGDAIIDMTQFTTYIGSSGETRRLDSYSQVVAQRLGFPVVVGATEQVAISPGDGIRLGLLYLTAENASGFVLNAATTTIDLQAAFNSSVPMNELGEAPAAPDLLEATVTGVIDAATIEVEIDGETIPVRYQGMIAPDVENCFSGQATLANRSLVMGQTVWLERQNANTDEDGAWLRDVWIESDSGSLELVADVLAEAGILDADVQRPNSRYAAYVETTVVIARSEGVGQWGGCD